MSEEFDAKSARAKRPLPLWVDAFMRDTMHLDAEQVGSYNLILCAMWTRHDLSLPADPRKLAIICRLTKTRFTRHVWPELEGFFEKTGNQLSQKRLKKEAKFVEQNILTQSQRKRGKKTGKSLKDNDTTLSGDNPGKISGTPGDQSPENPSQQPTTQLNNSEDKSSSLLCSDDDAFRRFMEAYPSDHLREGADGYEAWCQAISDGIDPEDIVAAAKRYAAVSRSFDDHLVMFSDNWLAARRWEKYPPPKSVEKSDQETAEFWGPVIIERLESGQRIFGLTDMIVALCLQFETITPEQAEAARRLAA